MSRVGKLPIDVPAGVDVSLADGVITVKSQHGQLDMPLSRDVLVSKEEDKIVVKPADPSRRSRAMWGTVRSRISNMVTGVTTGFTKKLEVRGVGYRAALSGDVLTLSLGFSHDVKFIVPSDITIKVEKQTIVQISGIDKEKVGQIAAELRSLRAPEPYKGKGVRYVDEYVRTKEGKKK